MNKGQSFERTGRGGIWALGVAVSAFVCLILLASFNSVHAEENAAATAPPAQVNSAQVNPVQATPESLVAKAADDLEQRRKLARELHDIKHVKDHIRETIAGVAKSLPSVEQEDFKKYIELKVDFDALEQKSIDYTAEIYTADELQAMVDFFGSREGRSADVKGEEYSEKFGAEVRKTIDQAMMAAKFDNMNALPQSLPTGPLSP